MTKNETIDKENANLFLDFLSDKAVFKAYTDDLWQQVLQYQAIKGIKIIDTAEETCTKICVQMLVNIKRMHGNE